MVITTGGTGITGRDVTPEAFDHVLEKRIEGFGELFRMLSYQKIGTSTMQSRALGGVAGGTYLFALPGSTGAVKDAWDDILVCATRQPASPLQPGGADAAATGTSEAGSGVAACGRSDRFARLTHGGADVDACGLDDIGARPQHSGAPSRAFPHRKAALAHIRSATELPVRPAGRRVPPPWSARNRCRQ